MGHGVTMVRRSDRDLGPQNVLLAQSDPAVLLAAQRAVLRQYEEGVMTVAETHEVLAMLALNERIVA